VNFKVLICSAHETWDPQVTPDTDINHSPKPNKKKEMVHGQDSSFGKSKTVPHKNFCREKTAPQAKLIKKK